MREGGKRGDVTFVCNGSGRTEDGGRRRFGGAIEGVRRRGRASGRIRGRMNVVVG